MFRVDGSSVCVKWYAAVELAEIVSVEDIQHTLLASRHQILRVGDQNHARRCKIEIMEV